MEQDDSVLEAKEITVSIAGKEYVWKEPPRAKRRQILADIMELEENFPFNSGKLSLFVRRWDAIAQLLVKYHPEMAKDKKRILNAEEDELLEVYEAVMEFVQSPFEDTMGKIQNKAASQKDSRS